jgi:penicillin amidase
LLQSRAPALNRRRRWSLQVSGTLEVEVSAPVRVVRDAWGIPHIYAQSADDLFFAQGFVQAQDRLFQLDLWRRSVQGRLAEVLGPNFAERDSSTRRMQYRGDPDAEWASYGADTRAIASAFVRGINAWVARARERPPEEFVVAGWSPEIWSPADLLNRTDAFVDSGDAIRRNRPRTSEPGGRGRHPARRHATVLCRIRRPPGTRLDHPSRRYFVHLHAPGWNVIGATAPWLPGVSIGHNDRIAWQSQPVTVDTQDVYADKARPVTAVFNDSLTIRGRKEAFDFTHEFTRHGVIVASDTEHDLVYAVRWSGFEAGGAAELAALALDRAQSWPEFRRRSRAGRCPLDVSTIQDVDGNRGFQVAALVPIRRGTEWVGWRTLDELPHGFTPAARGGRPSSRSQDPPRAADAAAPVVFAHPLGITDALRQRFHVGPLTPAGDARPFHVAFDAADWDHSSGMNAPGQSGSPASRHLSDLAQAWARGEDVTLAFSDAAVQAQAESTLTLVPSRSLR